MTRKEATIVSAYTGFLIGDFSDMHGYVTELLGREIWTHEFANKETWAEIKKKAKPDFVSIEISE